MGTSINFFLGGAKGSKRKFKGVKEVKNAYEALKI